MAVTHLNKVLAYAPYVREGDEAVVALTPEDWQVVADAMFRMDTPPEAFPDAIRDYGLADNGRTIRLDVEGYAILIEMG